MVNQAETACSEHHGIEAQEADEPGVSAQQAGAQGLVSHEPGTRGGELALSEVEKRVLAALSRRPLGLYPAASVAVAASTGRDETRTALERLVELGLVTGDPELVLARPVRREVVWRLDVAAAWSRVPDVLRFTRLPEVPPPTMPDELPERFAHLFWWGDTSLYKLPRDAAFVAEQILTSSDVTSWGWALFTLPCDALERVAAKPHLPDSAMRLINSTLIQRRAEPV